MKPQVDKLIALPVAGDSFLLQRQGRNILVDGGHGSKALVAALRSPGVAIDELDIVVCTHADSDHAGGLTDLLDKSSIRVREFWLPGAWSEALPGLLQDPRPVVDALVAEFDSVAPEDRDTPDLDDDDAFEARVHARVSEGRRRLVRERPSNPLRQDAAAESQRRGLEWLKEQAGDRVLESADAAASEKAFKRGRRAIRYRATKRSVSRRWTTFWINLIDTAERIRKIAVQAIRHDVNVRWFDFGKFDTGGQASGGEPGLLVPLNAVELVVPPPPLTSVDFWLRLTPVNEECLVLLSPGAGTWLDHLAVVFTGDSPLGTGPRYANAHLDWPPGQEWFVVATAPHHGSESNAAAYEHLQQKAAVLLWIRSGGSPRHPGLTYRALHPTQRACTHCPRSGLQRQVAEVQLTMSDCPIVFRVRAHDCNC